MLTPTTGRNVMTSTGCCTSSTEHRRLRCSIVSFHCRIVDRSAFVERLRHCSCRDAIVIAQSVYEVGAEGSTLELIVQANVDFTVSTDADWITQVATRGLTDYPLSFQIDSNESEEPRSGTIILTDANGGQQSITVNQAGKKAPGTETDIESYEKEEGAWE